MSLTTAYPEIKGIDFINDKKMVVRLDNGRVLVIPLDKFPSIQNMKETDKRDFEMIDGSNLSFLALDEIYTVKELLGF